jgi:hypothetical protein
MRKFIIKVSAFTFITIILFIVFLFLLRPTPQSAESNFFGAIKKDSLLLNELSPRIIFVGGSNLCFGLNSQMIKDSLLLNPINTAIHANIGIKYMLENTLQYLKKGDIVIFVPEYQHFCWKWDYGSEALLRTILDTNKSNIRLLSFKQIINCIPFIGNLVLSKFKRSEYVNIEDRDIYSIYSFNQYGDTYLHWNRQRQNIIEPDILVPDKYNPQVMIKIKNYSQKIKEKEALLFISYPGYQDISFQKSEGIIKKIEQEYIASGLTILGTPERYKMPDSILFDTPYHLIKAGVDYRTGLLIEDIRKQIVINDPPELEFFSVKNKILHFF